MIKRPLLFVILISMAAGLNAQWGIRYVLPQAETITKAGLFDLWLIGMGVDFDLSERTSCGIDLLLDTNWDEYGKDRQPANTPFGSSLYTEKLKVYGIQYRSQYHFSDNYSTSVYIGSTIGLRYVRQSVSGTVFTNGSFSDPTEYSDDGNGVIIPIGLRIGVRGGLEGGYADVYVGVGYAIGSSNELTKAPFLAEESELSALNLQLGFAFGFGR